VTGVEAMSIRVGEDDRGTGWVLVVIGVGQGLSGLAVSRRSEIGTWAGIGFALANTLAQMLVMQAYPWWSLAMFTLDLLVVYGLVVYGGRRLRPT
jgi:hypothetical protein